MLLILLKSPRQVVSQFVLLALIMNIATSGLGVVPPPPGVMPPLPTPTITGVTGNCPSMTATWTATFPNVTYNLVLMGPTSVTVAVQGNSYTFMGLTSGDYVLTVQAMSNGMMGNSGVSTPFPFSIMCGPVCQAPVVTIASASPDPICRGEEHKHTTVTFTGTVTSACALSGASYVLTDSNGPGLQGSVTVASDGTFALPLSLSNRHKGTVYTLTVTATNSMGSGTSNALSISVQKCRHQHADGDDRDRDDGSDHDQGHDD